MGKLGRIVLACAFCLVCSFEELSQTHILGYSSSRLLLGAQNLWAGAKPQKGVKIHYEIVDLKMTAYLHRLSVILTPFELPIRQRGNGTISHGMRNTALMRFKQEILNVYHGLVFLYLGISLSVCLPGCPALGSSVRCCVPLYGGLTRVEDARRTACRHFFFYQVNISIAHADGVC